MFRAMKRHLFILLLSASCALAAPPNFVIVYLDDLGWTDTSVEMIRDKSDTRSDFYQTPNLERLARQGTVFSSGYAPAPVCTPSRNSMLHGMTPARMRNAVLLPKESQENYQGKITIPQALKQADANYVAAHFGKWHNPTLTPKDAGFDVTDGPTGNGEGDYLKDMKTHLPDDDPKRLVSLTQRSKTFIRDQAKAGKPFFLQLSHYSVHIWHDSFKKTREKYRKLPRGEKCLDRDYLPEEQITESHFKHDWILNYAAMIDDTDATFGELLDTIDAHGLADNTYVIFTSDNGGGVRQNLPLRGSKADLTEGGIRVPLVVRGPRVPKGSYCNVPVTGWDFLQTFYELAGGTIPLPAGLDGGSLKDVFENGDKGKVTRNTEELIFHFPWYNGEPESAIRIGDYKLLKNLDTRKLTLFDLSKDIGEKTDLSGQRPELAASMEQRLEKYLKDVDAETVVRLRGYYLDNITQRWLPHEEKRVVELRAQVAAGDKSQQKELDRVEGYIKWLKQQVIFTNERLELHR
jgi:arylsulfatase A-like enzyme